ncbi:MAG: hypothetical protein SH856_14220 [Flavobacteriales bacterium]|nr:hypothetical protein [Flavobacteriales bacterium]
MKSILIILAMVFIAPYINAQGGNLQFSETKYIQLTGPMSIDGIVTTQELVVPEGQTWKIESAVATYKYSSGGSTTYSYTAGLKMLLDDIIIFAYDNLNMNPFPMWLSAGTYTLTFWSDTTWTPGLYTGNASVSILVFNIIP